MKPFSIMHISDLHRSPFDTISNDELISALVNDRNRYVVETPSITVPTAIVVSGDIIQGVSLHEDDFAAKIEKQYAVAEQFLDELVERFLENDRSRLIMVPGNHDVDWNTAFSALEPVQDEAVPDNLKAELHSEDSSLRWDWKTRTLYRINDPELYESRLDAFWSFYERFYKNVSGLPVAKNSLDVRLFSLCDSRIGVAAYNSCYGNDCFASHGMIRRGTVARSDLDLNDSRKTYDLRMAVWHHSIEGLPYHTDYMNIDVVRSMIGRGFRLGLHGHQHKAQVSPQEICLPDRERMAVIGAGSLCAGANDLPVGVHRQYNILEIAEDFRGVRIHVRAMAIANLFSRWWFTEFGGASHRDLDWESPCNSLGLATSTQIMRKNRLIVEAEKAINTGDPAHAFCMLESLELPPESYERQICLLAATETQNWDAVVNITDPPATIEELTQRFQAFIELGDFNGAVDVLDRFSRLMQLPVSLESELRSLANAQESMRK